MVNRGIEAESHAKDHESATKSEATQAARHSICGLPRKPMASSTLWVPNIRAACTFRSLRPSSRGKALSLIIVTALSEAFLGSENIVLVADELLKTPYCRYRSFERLVCQVATATFAALKTQYHRVSFRLKYCSCIADLSL